MIEPELLNADGRGTIRRVASGADVLLITSLPGARRANHYHLLYGHHCLVVSGVIDYYERPAGSTEKPSHQTYVAGDLFWTPPNVEHLMLFQQPTTFYCFSVGARDPKHYEADTVRMPFELDKV